MTKPRTKTREELTTEIEQAEKKIWQYENKEKILDRKLAIEKRNERNHRLCVRGGFMESLVPELITMTDEDAKLFLRLKVDWLVVSRQLYFTINLEEIFYFNNKKRRIYAVFGVSQTPNKYIVVERRYEYEYPYFG